MKSAAVDDILLAVRWWGRYEKTQFIMLMVPLLPTALHIVSVVFLGRAAEHRCAPLSRSPQHLLDENIHGMNNSSRNNPNAINQHSGIPNVYNTLMPNQNITPDFMKDTTVKFSQCSVEVLDRSGNLLSSVACPNGYQYTEPRERTFVSEWDLVCESEALSDLSQTIMGVGMSLGAFCFTNLSDRYGRKKSYLLADLMLFVMATATAFAPNFAVFAVLRFLTGAAHQGASLVSYVLMMEQLPTNHRSLCTRVGMIVWPLCLLSTSLFAYLTREVSWRYLQLALAATSIYVLGQYWVIDESLRWLLANGRRDEAERIVKKAVRWNGVNEQKVMEVFRQPSLVPLTSTTETDGRVKARLGDGKVGNETNKQAKQDLGITAIVKDRYVLKITAISCYMWFADSATYYGLILTSGSLVNDLYLGFAVNILVELPAGLAFFVLTNRMSRRKLMVIFHLVAGLALLAVVALTTIQAAQSIPGINIIVVIVSLIGKFGSAAGYGMLWLYTPELFPTNIRTTGFGLSSLAARIGVMVTPFSRTLGRHLPWAPGIIFSILCLLIPVLTWFLPEMHGRELPQSTADMDRQRKDRDGHKRHV